MTGPLADRGVVVTGAGRGVGRGVALACAAAGADVVVAAPGDNGADTVAAIEERGGSARVGALRRDPARPTSPPRWTWPPAAPAST